MTRYAAVTDFHITIYSFANAPTGKPVIDDGRQIDKIDIPGNIGRSFANYEKLLRAAGWIPSGGWGFAIARSRENSEQPCVEVS